MRHEGDTSTRRVNGAVNGVETGELPMGGGSGQVWDGTPQTLVHLTFEQSEVASADPYQIRSVGDLPDQADANHQDALHAQKSLHGRWVVRTAQ